MIGPELPEDDPSAARRLGGRGGRGDQQRPLVGYKREIAKDSGSKNRIKIPVEEGTVQRNPRQKSSPAGSIKTGKKKKNKSGSRLGSGGGESNASISSSLRI